MTESIQTDNGIFRDPEPQITAANKELGRDEFLHLLTVQMREQNPLEPTDNGEFAAQLAQFSSLETLTDIREAIENQSQTNVLLTQAVSNTGAASLIGKTIKAGSDSLNFDGSNPISLGYNLFANAESVQVEIRDSSGNLIRTLRPSTERNQGENIIEWDGTNEDGISAPKGEYTFTVQATDRNGLDLEADPIAFGRVSAVRFKPEGTILVVGESEIFLSDVSDIRD